MQIRSFWITLAGIAGALSATAAHIQTPTPRLAFGQAPASSQEWIAHGAKYSLTVDGSGATVHLHNWDREESLTLRFIGANPKVQATPESVQPGRINYLLGNDPKRWIRDSPTYGRLGYSELYPKTDVVWYGADGNLEYDLVLSPGADPKAIRLHLDGAKKIAQLSDGIRADLVHGSVDLRAPLVYQEVNGHRQNVPCRYELAANGDIAFHLDRYNTARPVVIDPVLVYSTYFGFGESGGSLTGVDASGNQYVATQHSYVPVTADIQPGFTGARSLAITKFDGAGTLQYSTYLGSSSQDYLKSMSVASDGTVALSGSAGDATTFPFTETAPSVPNGQSANSAFVLKLNAAGNAFVFVAQIQNVGTNAITSDAGGNIYVAGSGSVPVTTGSYNAGAGSFLVKYTPAGAVQYVASLPFGVNLDALTAEDSGAIYVAGHAGAVPSSLPGNPTITQRNTGVGGSNILFVAKLSSDGTQLPWASLLGVGSDSESSVEAVVRDPATGTIYAVATTTDTSIPTTAGAWQTIPALGQNGLLFALSSDGASFPAITYLRGASQSGIAMTANGVVVEGSTTKPIPTVSAIQPNPPASLAPAFKSTDGGATWSSLSGALSFIDALWVDPQNASLLLAFSRSNGIYRSPDAGATWTNVFQNGSGFAVSPDGGTFYTTSSTSLYASADQGLTWHQVAASTLSEAGEGISVNPQNPLDIVVIGYSDIVQSLDGGLTFTDLGVSNGPTPNGSLATFTDAAGDILVATDTGFSRSADRGKSWQNAGTQSYVAIAAQSISAPSTVYASYDSGNLYKTTDFGLTWTTLQISAAANAIAVSPTNPNNVYVSDYSGDIYQSTDGGVTWSLTGPGPDVTAAYVLAVDSSTPAQLYVVNADASAQFLAKLNSSLTGAVWSTYYGGTATELSAIAGTPSSSDVWITGGSYGGFFPATQPESFNAGTIIARISDATPACTYVVNPQTQNIAYETVVESAVITAPSGCAWTATSDSDWINIRHGASGNGSGLVTAQLVANNTSQTRTGHVSVAGQTITISEPAAGCTYTILSSISAPSGGGTVKVPIVTQPGCIWDVQSYGNAAAITSATSGTGTGSVTVTVPAPSTADPNNEYYVDAIIVAEQVVNIAPATPQIGSALQFIPVTPCRIADTRKPSGPYGGPIITGQTSRDFNIPASPCSIPSSAQAYSVNVTVVPSGPLGYLTMWPSGQPLPLVSTLNSVDGRVKASAAIVGAGDGGSISVFATNDTHVVLDINGYFVPASTQNALSFYPLTPCRVADTRKTQYGSLGPPSLTGGAARDLAIQTSQCNIPSTAQAYSMNFTAVPKTTLGFLTVWPSGQTRPTVSTLNATTGEVTANAAIVPAGTGGNISVFASNDSDLVVDVNGYFAPPGTGGLSLYTITPCRVFDSRSGGGSPLTAATSVNVAVSSCGAPSSAQAYVTNATVVPSGGLGYLTLWPQGGAQPTVSTLNALDGVVTSNLAIVPATNGVISAFPSNATHLIVDLSSYFAQ